MHTKKFTKYHHFVLFLLFFFTITKSFAGLPPIPKAAPGVNLSPEQVDRMTKELENIDKFFNSLPPEEQMEFLKQVEEAQKMISSLSEDELAQLVKDMEQMMPELFEGIPMDALTKPIAQPEKLTPVTVPMPIKQEKIVLSKEEELALQCIESLIKLINQCSVKINSSPEISLNIERWIRNDKIKYWKKEHSWNHLLSKIEELTEKINALQTQDPFSSEYRHLKEVIKDKNLLNALQKLEKALLTTVPNIDIPTLGIEKMTKKSKELLQKAVTGIGEALINDNIIKNIENILIKFNPEATKIKATEKKETLRAQQQAQIKPQQGRTVVAGKAQELDGSGFASSRNPDYYSYGSGSSYNYDAGAYASPVSSGSASQPSPISASQKSNATTQPKSGSSSTPSSGKSSPTTESTGSKPAKLTSFDKAIEEIIDMVVDMGDTIGSVNALSNMETYLKSSSSIDSKTINTLNDLQKNVEDLNKKINSFNRKLSDAGELRKKYKAKLTNSFNKYKEPLSKIRTAINNTKSRIKSLPAEKQYAFFKENIVFAEDKERPLQLQSSLIDLAETIAKVETNIQK